MPVLVIWGEANMALDLICLHGTEKYVTDLTVKRLPGISYWVQQGATEAVNALLGGFPAPALQRQAWLSPRRAAAATVGHDGDCARRSGRLPPGPEWPQAPQRA